MILASDSGDLQLNVYVESTNAPPRTPLTNMDKF